MKQQSRLIFPSVHPQETSLVTSSENHGDFPTLTSPSSGWEPTSESVRISLVRVDPEGAAIFDVEGCAGVMSLFLDLVCQVA